MNLVVKAVATEYEDAYFVDNLDDAEFYGVYDWVERELKTFNEITKEWRVFRLYPYADEWIAAFVNLDDAWQYLDWKKSQNV